MSFSAEIRERRLSPPPCSGQSFVYLSFLFITSRHSDMKFTSTLCAAAGLLGAACPALAAPLSPSVEQPALTRRQSANSTVSEPLVPTLNVSYTSDFNSSLPTVIIAATGGTIAGSSSSATDTTKYTAGVVGVEALVQGRSGYFGARRRLC